MQIKNVRFSYGLLRDPTEEEDRLVETRGFVATLLMSREKALAVRVPLIVGYNPQKLLPSPERLKREWMDRMIGFFTKEMLEYSEATIVFETGKVPLMIPGEDITLSRALAGPRWADLYPGDEIIVSQNARHRQAASRLVRDVAVKVETVVTKGYLDHDPTKNHRKRRRRR